MFFFSAMRIDKMDKIESIVPNCPSGLCISKQDFLKPDFSVDNFFIEQSVKDTPLDTLRDDLGIYLKVNSSWLSISSGSGSIFGWIRVLMRPGPGPYNSDLDLALNQIIIVVFFFLEIFILFVPI